MGQGAEEYTPAPPAATTEERPSWLPEKFTTEAEFVAAYGNLEKEFTQTRQQVSELETTIERMVEAEDYNQPQQQESRPLQGMDALELLSAYEEALVSGDGRTAMAISLGLQQNQLQEALAPIYNALGQPQDTSTQDLMFAKLVEESTSRRIGNDYEEIRGDVADVLRENPHLMPNTNDPEEVASAITLVADAVRGRRVAQQDPGDQRKIAAQTLRGRTGSTPEAQELRGAIKDALSRVGPGFSSR